MYQTDAEMMFPARVIPSLRSLRGQDWQKLVDQVIAAGAGSTEQQAFMLMMIRLNSCLTCHADSYRAMRGCTLCAQQSVARYKGDDLQLINSYEQSKVDVILWQETGEIPLNEQPPPED